ncbi:MAG TPA: sugar ABC transporter permease [Thermomicrobiaceae bacterium]|nr:sugar ABC transporter permease [Thermomicrobiaceae bacterium]
MAGPAVTEGQQTRPVAPSKAPQPRATSSLARRQARLAWLLLLPTLLVVAFVAIYPLIQTIWYGFTNARLGSVTPPRFVGLKNYQDLIADSAFRSSILVTVKFTVITVVIEFLLGMLIALVVNSNFKGRGLTRAAMLVPWAIPTVISAQMWKWMYHDVYGVFNDLLVNKLGLLSHNVAWLSQPNTSLPAIAAVDIWKTTPFVALLLLAGLQVIPSDVYEAATVDGANRLRQFFDMTLPLLQPAIVVTLIFRTLDALRVFDVFYVAFGARPDTMTMAIYDQQNIVAFADVGYGSAISMAIFVVIAIFVIAYVTTFKVEAQ